MPDETIVPNDAPMSPALQTFDDFNTVTAEGEELARRKALEETRKFLGQSSEATVAPVIDGEPVTKLTVTKGEPKKAADKENK